MNLRPASDTTYVAARAWWGLSWSLMTTMSLVYMVVDARLDPLQMVLVGTALELSVFLFEIPTGVVADLVSRKLSVVIGHAGIGLGFLFMALVPDFWAIVAANVFWGISYTFISGAYPAWLSSEVGKERAGAAFLRGSQLSHAGSFIGIAIAVWFAHTSLSLPIVAGAFSMMALAAWLAFAMREDHFEPAAPTSRDTWTGFAETFTGGVQEVRRRPILLLVLGITFIFGMFSEGLDRLFTPFVVDGFNLPALGPLDSVAWWGLIAAVAHAVGLVATTVARRRIKLAEVRRLTWVMSGALAVVAVMVLLMSQANSLVVVLACYWIAQGARSVYGPLMTGWLNRLMPEKGKATLFSLYGQSDALGQTIGGPGIGYLAKAVSIRFGLATSAVLLLPSVLLFRRSEAALAVETM